MANPEWGYVFQHRSYRLGTTSPTEHLHVRDALAANILLERHAGSILRLSAQVSAASIGTINAIKLYIVTDNFIRMAVSGTGDVSVGSAFPDGHFLVRQNNQDDILNLYDGGINVMTVLDGGNVGIGTESTSYDMEVVGDFAVTNATEELGLTPTAMTMSNEFFVSSPANISFNVGSDYLIQPGRDLTMNAGARLEADASFVDINATGSMSLSSPNTSIDGLLRLGINTSPGGLQLAVAGVAAKTGGGSWAVLSDRRLKKNIQPLDGSLDRLLALRGVTFEYKETDVAPTADGIQTGMVAQEVEVVFPEWVTELDNGYKVLTCSGFEALTVEALREMQEKYDSEIATLERRLEKLE